MRTASTFAQWSLEAIRKEDSSFSWLEEQRFEWTTATLQAIEQILLGKTVVLVTDHKRKWLESYLLTNINSMRLERPFIPIVSIDHLYAHLGATNSDEMLEAVDDMIALSYKDDYFFWYIGRGDDKRADIAKKKESSYFWIFDEEYVNAFTMKSYDKLLDIKLLQLYRIFNASLNGALFGEIDIELS